MLLLLVVAVAVVTAAVVAVAAVYAVYAFAVVAFAGSGWRVKRWRKLLLLWAWVGEQEGAVSTVFAVAVVAFLVVVVEVVVGNKKCKTVALAVAASKLDSLLAAMIAKVVKLLFHDRCCCYCCCRYCCYC